MKRLLLIALGIGLVAAPLATGNLEAGSCKLEGVWYGFNTYGEDFVLTIHREGGGLYTGLAINPNTSAQGDFRLKGRGVYDTTWLTYVAGDPFGFPGQLLAVHMNGEMRMTSCDSWTAVTDWEIYLFSPGLGEDPFANPPVNQIPGVELFYQRMP